MEKKKTGQSKNLDVALPVAEAKEKPQEQASEKVFKASLNRYGFIHVGKRFREALGWPANVNVHLEATVEGGKVTFAIKSGSDAD